MTKDKMVLDAAQSNISGVERAEIGNCIWEYKIKEREIEHTAEISKFFGVAENIVNLPNSLVESGAVHRKFVKSFNDMYERINAGEKMATWIGKMRDSNGEYIWVKTTYITNFDSDGNPITATGISENISELKNNDFIRIQNNQYRTVMESDVIVAYKLNFTTNCVEMNMCGKMASSDEVCDTLSCTELFQAAAKKITNADDRKRFETIVEATALRAAFREGTPAITMEYRRSYLSGRIAWVAASISLVKDPKTGDLLGFFYIRDIDEKKKIELALSEKAERDAITELYNRETTKAMVTEILSNHDKRNVKCAMLMVDFNCIKQITENIGAEYTDKILSEIGSNLKNTFNFNAILGRVDEDKFVVFLDNIPSKEWASEKAAAMCEALKLSYFSAEKKYDITCAVGIAISSIGSTTYAELFQKSDAALYDARKKGDKLYSVYTQISASKKIVLEHDCIAKDFFHKQCMMDEIENIAFVIDFETDEILYLNAAGRKMFGAGYDEYIGRKCYEFINGLTEPCTFCNRREIRDDKFQTWEHTVQKVNRNFLIKDKLMKWGNKRVRLEMFTDMSTKVGVDNFSVDKINVENVLLRCTASLLSSGSFDLAVKMVLESICEFYMADRTCILELDSVNSVANVSYEWSRPKLTPTEDSTTRLAISDIERWVEAFKQDKPVIISDVETIKDIFPLEYGILKKLGISTFYAVPLLMQGVPSGYIGIENPKSHLGNLTLIDSLSYFVMNEMYKSRMQKRQQFLSYHDALTGLKNRNSYIEYLGSITQEAVSSMGVVVTDINGLKGFNQSMGHQFGDKLVIDTAESLKRSFAGNNIYRFSGDEFVILCQDVTHDYFVESVQAAKAAIENENIGNGVSFGSTWADIDIDVDRLIAHADEYLMISKQEYYERSIISNASKHYRPEMLENLQNCMARNEFIMYLQPKADIETGQIVGAEALVRYQSEKTGLISPDRFIPTLERENLIKHIDLFIMEEVCKMLEDWKNRGLSLFPISLNFSRVTLLEKNLIELMRSIHRKYDIPRELIEIEITESIGEIERETISEIGANILNEGFRLSLDDFGSKYTSIFILSIMDINVLKLDRSMVNNIVTNAKSRSIVKHVLQICKDIGIKSVAEGIETKEQLSVLKMLGCDYAQGYYYSKPIPYERFAEKYL